MDARGVPRKPRQSDHALWVGNLSSGADVVDLKDHFFQYSTNDIHSVFLISKSNCAFVNCKSDTARLKALSRFHNSRFQGVKLVCQPRQEPGPGDLTSSTSSSSFASDGNVSQSMRTELTSSQRPGEDADSSPSTMVQEKYFILKSSTVEDLELSRQSCTWATQIHNEDRLNRAYKVL